ncbi:hypothetical protein [Leucobacter sp. GX24907]
MDPAILLLIIYILAGLLAFITTLLILWSVIRSAVLSALRAHSEETRQ